MSVPCRCSKCRTRRTIRKSPAWYIRPPRCLVCGGPLSIDHHRASGREKRPPTCRCGLLPFPHRLGCHGCQHQDAASYFHSAWRQEGGELTTSHNISNEIPF